MRILRRSLLTVCALICTIGFIGNQTDRKFKVDDPANSPSFGGEYSVSEIKLRSEQFEKRDTERQIEAGLWITGIVVFSGLTILTFRKPRSNTLLETNQ
jgi:hypothetical protein